MTVRPQPWVELDGSRIYCKADRLTQGVTILDGLTVDWGQTHAMEDRKAAVARFRLWDADGYWLRRAATNAWDAGAASPTIGIDVVVGWTVDDTTRVIFRGTVSNMDIAQSDRKVSEFTSAHGWDLTITATDRPTQLGEVTLGKDIEWPAESAITRANRLRTAISDAGIDIAAVYFEPDTVNWPMGKTKVADKTLLTLVDEFYSSFGIRWDYRPDENVTRPAPIIRLIRGQYIYRVPGTADHVFSSGSHTLTGFGDDTAEYVSTPLRGCDLTVDNRQVAIDRTARINAIELTYLKADGTEWSTGIGPAAGSGVKRRQADYSTWLNLDSPNNGNASRFWESSWDRMRATNWPAHPPVTLDTKLLDGGFMGVHQAFTLTRACQSWAAVTILGSPYDPAIGRLSQHQVIGGSVRYEGGRWIVNMNLSPTGGFSYGGTSQSWQTVRDLNSIWSALTWNDPSIGRLDRSVTWADVKEIASQTATAEVP